MKVEKRDAGNIERWLKREDTYRGRIKKEKRKLKRSNSIPHSLLMAMPEFPDWRGVKRAL